MRISDWSSDVCSSDLGLPPNEQHFLLVTRTGIPPVYRLDYRARRIRLGRRDRLDALSAAFHERIAWPSCRHGDTFNAPGGSIFHPWGHHFHHHHLEHARTGHDRSEEHTSDLQSLMRSSYAVLCLKKNILHHLQYIHK